MVQASIAFKRTKIGQETPSPSSDLEGQGQGENGPPPEERWGRRHGAASPGPRPGAPGADSDAAASEVDTNLRAGASRGSGYCPSQTCRTRPGTRSRELASDSELIPSSTVPQRSDRLASSFGASTVTYTPHFPYFSFPFSPDVLSRRVATKTCLTDHRLLRPSHATSAAGKSDRPWFSSIKILQHKT
jgi:hypothetical protein